MSRVPPLTCSTLDGRPYRRRADVEESILHALERPPAEWPAMASRTGEGHLPDEAVVFLMREIRSNDRDNLGRLVHELGLRIARIAKRHAQGFDRDTTFEIVEKVEKQVIDLILAETPSRQSEFLEIAFQKAVERRTINAVAKRKQAPLPLRAAPVEAREDDDEEPERLTERVPDERPNPEEIVSEFEDLGRRPELVRKALNAVKDPRHRDAVILRYLRNWPITDQDPNKPTLARHFGVSGRQIRNWLNDALKAMRAAIGD